MEKCSLIVIHRKINYQVNFKIKNKYVAKSMTKIRANYAKKSLQVNAKIKRLNKILLYSQKLFKFGPKFPIPFGLCCYFIPNA